MWIPRRQESTDEEEAPEEGGFVGDGFLEILESSGYVSEQDHIKGRRIKTHS